MLVYYSPGKLPRSINHHNLKQECTLTELDQEFRQASSENGTLKVLQLTDTHICDSRERRLYSIDTGKSLERTVDHFLSQNWQPGLVLLTGDLVHDGGQQGHARLVDILKPLEYPLYCLPGNHDNPDYLQGYLGDHGIASPAYIDSDHWRIILLDTCVPDSKDGHLSITELTRLDKNTAETGKHVLVCLHHQPLPIRSAWLDTMMVDNGDDFLSIIEKHKNVMGVLWGHVHQVYEKYHKDIRLMATPSTCVQFKPESQDFEIDDKPPGYRLLILKRDGGIQTRVLRL